MPGAPESSGDWLDGDEPKWEVIDFDLPCSRCGYDLRMLTVPRCPECGLHFRWREVFEARLLKGDYLFEHNWRLRPVRAWFTTLVHALRPWSFWERVSIHARIHTGPLMFLFVSSWLVFVGVLHGGAALAGGVFWMLEQVYLPSPGGPPLIVSELCDGAFKLARLPMEVGPYYALLLGFIVVSLLAATALLCTLRQTLGRCRVRTVQVFRVVAYAATPVCMVWALLAVLSTLAGTVLLRSAMLWVELALVLGTLALGVAALGSHLAMGLKHYLELPRAWLLGLTAAVVGLLSALTAYLAVARFVL